ncbi:MAG: hypothetical protein RL180_1363 [Pseudomonadota bacterium]|jgi:hypothetical protein
MSRQKTTPVNLVEMFKPVRVDAIAPVMLALLLPVSSLHAAQPLTDAELDYRYLTVDAKRALVMPSAQSASSPVLSLMSMTPSIPAHFDTLQMMVAYQGQQLSTGVTGAQANSQKTFDSLVASNLGSERYSFRWAGNLQDIVEISDLSSFFFNFSSITDVELVGVDTNIGIEVNIHRNGRR